MDEDAPRPVPPHQRETLHLLWFYCLHCRHQESTSAAMRLHERNHHFAGSESDPVLGVDYTNGQHLLVLLDRWEEWSLTIADKFALSVASLRGPDDFIHEVGDGLKVDG